MKRIIYLFSLFGILSCNSKNQTSSVTVDSVKLDSVPLIFDKMLEKVKQIELQYSTRTCDYLSLKKELESFKILGLAAIPAASVVIKNCIELLKPNEKDSIYLQFDALFNYSAISTSFILEPKFSSILDVFEQQPNDSLVRNLRSCFAYSGLNLAQAEGSYYLKADPEYYEGIFKGKISAEIDQYLAIHKIELAEIYADDGGLLISLDQLYDRIKAWEGFMEKNPKSFLNKDVNLTYNSYLVSFLYGMDNTPNFEYETNVIKPEAKLLFEKILDKDGSRRSDKIIRIYYEKLKANDFKKLENMNEMLKELGLD